MDGIAIDGPAAIEIGTGIVIDAAMIETAIEIEIETATEAEFSRLSKQQVRSAKWHSGPFLVPST